MNLESAVNIFLRQLLVKFANTVQTLRNSQALDGTIKLTVVRLNTLVEFTALKFSASTRQLRNFATSG